jgi:phosphopantetheinyl transferase (holo-ACP synthase)
VLPRDHTLALAVDSPSSEWWMTAAEREACAAIADPARRRDWRAARLAGRWAAAGALGLPRSADLEILPVPGAPPAVAVRDATGSLRPADVSLSVAHRRGRGAAVASAGPAAVGVDLERIAAVPPRFARYFLTPAERTVLGRRSCVEMWALKEAAWKASRCTDSVYFTELELGFTDDAELDRVTLRGRTLPASGELYEPWAEFVLAVVRLVEAPA